MKGLMLMKRNIFVAVLFSLVLFGLSSAAFANRDPLFTGPNSPRPGIDSREGMNLYNYVQNDPLDNTDPLGLWPDSGNNSNSLIQGRPGTFLPIRPGTPPVGLPDPYGSGSYWPYSTPNPFGPGNLPNTPTMPTPPNPCSGYDKYANSKCNLDDDCKSQVTDPYPAKAKKVCEGFMNMYNYSPSAICVARCLTSSEESITTNNSCSERNTKRLNAHVYCYAVCAFIPDKGMPDGADDVGWGMLWKDWKEHYGRLK
jgi:hypothetical protein